MTAGADIDPRSLATLPGLRTLASPRFRVVLALMLTVVGMGMLVLYPSLLSAAGFEGGHDFFAYLAAAGQVLEGSSPYTAEQLDVVGAAVCLECFLYPPLLAQLLAPLTLLPSSAAELAWYGVQFVAMYAAMWMATGLGGARRGLERAMWCLVAMLLFLPVFSSFWYGNVSTVVALAAVLVAAGGTVAGLGASAAALLKASPATLVPVAFLADRKARRSVVFCMVVVLGVSFLFAPNAWLEYPRVLLGLSAYAPDSLAPASVVGRLAVPEVVVQIVRLGTLVVGGVAMFGSWWLARRPDGLRAAALLAAIAMLLIPGTVFYHYLAIVLPFAAMAWPRASMLVRATMLMAAVVITAAFAVDGLALVGATAMVALTLPVLWPARIPT